mmetsp:Transcript_58418/g.114804  ORF Transcript_58418/g.114804 Transcript_58418/m.114804 type:complete len:123 (+) Transcript_58418:349-717(+)
MAAAGGFKLKCPAPRSWWIILPSQSTNSYLRTALPVGGSGVESQRQLTLLLLLLLLALVVVAVAMRFGVVVVGRGGGVACSFCGGVACVARTSLGRPRRVGGTCLGSNNSGDAVLVPDAGAQ